MNAHFLMPAFLTLAITLGSPAAWSADTAADAAQVKLQAYTMAEIKVLAEVTGGYKAKDVELSSTAHQMMLTIINTTSLSRKVNW